MNSLGICTRPDILVARVELAKFLKHCPCCKTFICDFGTIQIVLRYRMRITASLLNYCIIFGCSILGLISKQNATKYPVASHLLYKMEILWYTKLRDLNVTIFFYITLKVMKSSRLIENASLASPIPYCVRAF